MRNCHPLLQLPYHHATSRVQTLSSAATQTPSPIRLKHIAFEASTRRATVFFVALRRLATAKVCIPASILLTGSGGRLHPWTNHVSRICFRRGESERMLLVPRSPLGADDLASLAVLLYYCYVAVGT